MHVASVDLGSNSFRLQIGRVEANEIVPESYFKEGVRIAAGLDDAGNLSLAAQQRALNTLSRFKSLLVGFPTSHVRAVGTQTLRVAKNALEFIEKAQKALGYPIEVLRGNEEARLIFVGCSHALQPSLARRLIVDIGGASTELSVGQGYQAQVCNSFHVGCVSLTLAYFADGIISRSRFEAAQLAAYSHLIEARKVFSAPRIWDEAYGSSGSMEAICSIARTLGLNNEIITREDLHRIRDYFIDCGEIKKLQLEDLHQSRKDVIAGGLAVLCAVFDALEINQMAFSSGALRMGVLYDLLDKLNHNDCRTQSINRLLSLVQWDREQTTRVDSLSAALMRSLIPDGLDEEKKCLHWAAQLHEIGTNISHNGFHHHGAYIVEHADLVGFSASSQRWIADLILAQRGELQAFNTQMRDSAWTLSLLCLRLACIFAQERTRTALPELRLLSLGTNHFELQILSKNWLETHPLIKFLLGCEVSHWKAVQYTFDFRYC